MQDNSTNTVFVAKKTTIAYVFAVQTQAQQQTTINIRARGQNISKAVDVCQIAIDRFLKEWDVTETQIGTEEQRVEDDKRVSFINIKIQKK